MKVEFSGEIFEWRGPAPFYFVAAPEEESAKIKSIASQITYGWGVLPVTAKINKTEWTTALIPKDGLYLVPLKQIIQKAESLELGQLIKVRLTFVV